MKHNDVINDDENGYYVKTNKTMYLLRIRNGINGNNVEPQPPPKKHKLKSQILVSLENKTKKRLAEQERARKIFEKT
jgi:hypothetical protein